MEGAEASRAARNAVFLAFHAISMTHGREARGGSGRAQDQGGPTRLGALRRAACVPRAKAQEREAVQGPAPAGAPGRRHPDATLHRYAVTELGHGRRATTIPVDDCEPGEEVHLDTGWELVRDLLGLAPGGTAGCRTAWSARPRPSRRRRRRPPTPGAGRPEGTSPLACHWPSRHTRRDAPQP